MRAARPESLLRRRLVQYTAIWQQGVLIGPLLPALDIEEVRHFAHCHLRHANAYEMVGVCKWAHTECVYGFTLEGAFFVLFVC